MLKIVLKGRFRKKLFFCKHVTVILEKTQHENLYICKLNSSQNTTNFHILYHRSTHIKFMYIPFSLAAPTPTTLYDDPLLSFTKKNNFLFRLTFEWKIKNFQNKKLYQFTYRFGLRVRPATLLLTYSWRELKKLMVVKRTYYTLLLLEMKKIGH